MLPNMLPILAFFSFLYWANITCNIGPIKIANIEPILGKRFILSLAQYWAKIGCNIGHTLAQYFLLLGYGGNDVIAISTARGRLGVFKIADSESLTPICY
jgi:hypothetical protein